MGHNYMGPNYIDHDYMDHNYMGHNYICVVGNHIAAIVTGIRGGTIRSSGPHTCLHTCLHTCPHTRTTRRSVDNSFSVSRPIQLWPI